MVRVSTADVAKERTMVRRVGYDGGFSAVTALEGDFAPIESVSTLLFLGSVAPQATPFQNGSNVSGKIGCALGDPVERKIQHPEPPSSPAISTRASRMSGVAGDFGAHLRQSRATATGDLEKTLPTAVE